MTGGTYLVCALGQSTIIVDGIRLQMEGGNGFTVGKLGVPAKIVN